MSLVGSCYIIGLKIKKNLGPFQIKALKTYIFRLLLGSYSNVDKK